MKIKILKVQKSNRSIWETKLSINGPISDATAPGEESYEMIVNLYDGETSSLPTRTIIIEEPHHQTNISIYGMEALLKGVEIASLFNVMMGHSEVTVDHYTKEVESIAYSIVARMEQDTFFNNYNPAKMREYIEDKLLSLRDKFKIEPK